MGNGNHNFQRFVQNRSRSLRGNSQAQLAESHGHVHQSALRPITTTQVSQSVRRYLKTVASAEIHRAAGARGRFTPGRWDGQVNQALGALKALRSDMADAESGEAS